MKFLKMAAFCGVLSLWGGVAFAGAVDGPTNQQETVEQGKTDVYRVRFNGGEKASVRAKAHGDDIDIFIYDSHDNLIQKDDQKGNSAACTWTPKATEEFKIKIVNNETHSVDYKLETN